MMTNLFRFCPTYSALSEPSFGLDLYVYLIQASFVVSFSFVSSYFSQITSHKSKNIFRSGTLFACSALRWLSSIDSTPSSIWLRLERLPDSFNCTFFWSFCFYLYIAIISSTNCIIPQSLPALGVAQDADNSRCNRRAIHHLLAHLRHIIKGSDRRWGNDIPEWGIDICEFHSPFL